MEWPFLFAKRTAKLLLAKHVAGLPRHIGFCPLPNAQPSGFSLRAKPPAQKSRIPGHPKNDVCLSAFHPQPLRIGKRDLIRGSVDLTLGSWLL